MICTALLGIAPGNRGLLPPYSLIIYTVCIIAGVMLFSALAGENFNLKSNKFNEDEGKFANNKALFAVLFSFVLLLSILYGISSQFISSYSYKGINVAVARGFTAFGLIFAGFLADKNRKISFLISIIGISFTSLLLVLYRSSETAFFLSSLTYILTGFYVVYPLVAFTDFAAYAPAALVSGIGVLSLRLGP
jgi:hypothetical protein